MRSLGLEVAVSSLSAADNKTTASPRAVCSEATIACSPPLLLLLLLVASGTTIDCKGRELVIGISLKCGQKGVYVANGENGNS